MPPIINQQLNSFSYSSLHNNLNTLHNVPDLTIPLLYITTPCNNYALLHFTPPYITSALPQITKRDRTLLKLHNTLHYSTSPLHYHNLRNMTEPCHSQTMPHSTARNLCFTIRHHASPLLNYTISIPDIAIHYHCFALITTPCFTIPYST